MTTRLLAVLALTGAVIVSVVAGGCQKSLSPADTTATGSGAADVVASAQGTPNEGGALLWSQNCARCHNLRNPHERSDHEWDIIVHHMRVRAGLTANEHRQILRFLQSAN